MKRLGGGNYFDELLARIRDIRSSEKVFWRKVLEIYATSIDYDPHAESSILFFKQVQNKMHWAAHKHTAAEVIYQRADAEKDNMGLTSWTSDTIHRSDVEVAKNYLTEQELDALNKIVTAYLDIAEVHALNKEPMYMKDWLETIDDYLKMTRVIFLPAADISAISRLLKKLIQNMINTRIVWKIHSLLLKRILLIVSVFWNILPTIQKNNILLSPIF